MIDDGGPAYPQHLLWTANSGVVTSSEVGEGGMSLRDRFAIAALQGGLCFDQEDGCIKDEDYAAGIAYRFADAMLRARKQS